MKEFRDFESAREFVRALNLKGQKEWLDYCKSGSKPNDVPSYPNQVYKKDFKGVGDFLGNERRSFTEAREFVQKLGLKEYREWQEYCKSGELPDDIPSNPGRTYKKDFKGVGDWLGTGTVASKNKLFLSFTEAREFVRKLELKGLKEWEDYRKSGNKPENIPTNPNTIYKNEFKGMGDWLGTGRIAYRDMIYRPFKEAREFARALNFKNRKEWAEYCRSEDKPDDISASPDQTYKNDFKGVGDWLGTEWRSFNEARDFVRTLKIKNHKEWQEYCKSGNKPDDIPATPWDVYKEWKKK
jgi:exonuclease I